MTESPNKKRPYMQFKIMHLLHYRWEGPSFGVRIRFGRHYDSCRVYGAIIPIPQWFSDFLKFLSRNRKSNPGEF
jgi:hypothetical protein